MLVDHRALQQFRQFHQTLQPRREPVHVMRELLWTYLLGWQNVAMGLLIVVVVVFFPRGVLGMIKRKTTA